MTNKETRLLNVGILGCGQIAQAAHFESCNKARNCRLHAICDSAPDLLERMSWAHAPEKTFARYEAMIADPDLDAVIIATADAFHLPASLAALAAGKHVLLEKPAATSIEEALQLRHAVRASGKTLQIGHMKRFDPGIEAAKAFIDEGFGQMLAFKAWYCDSTHRYTMTDAVQPFIFKSALAKRPPGDAKSNLRRYYMLAHGSHLLDTARFLAGEIAEVSARFSERYGALCWFVETAFVGGALGHLDLTVAVRMDWHEGFHIYGEGGSIIAKTYNPWYFRSSDVEIFRESDATTLRPLGADGHFYRRQLESFADVILHGRPMTGADIDDGVASLRAMTAISQSARSGKPVRLSEAAGPIE